MIEPTRIYPYLNALKEGKTILFPTGSTIGLGCDFKNQEAFNILRSLNNQKIPPSHWLVVSSVEMLRRYVDDLHPRIETLLVYHRRPLRVIYKANLQMVPEHLLGNNRSIDISLSHHHFCRQLVSELGRPLVVINANTHNNYAPIRFSEIPSEIKNQSFHENIEELDVVRDNKLAVVASFNQDEEINIIRD